MNIAYYLLVSYIIFITMRKQRIRLSEATLHNIIRKCVNEAVSTIKNPSLKKEMQLDNDEEYEEYEDGGHYYKNKFVEIKHSKPYIDAITDLTSYGIDMVDEFFEKFKLYYRQLNGKEKEQFKTLICDGWGGNGDMFKQLEYFKEWMQNCNDEANDVINFYA